MNTILFDGTDRDYLLPFVYTRPVAEIRVGILSLREKWNRALKKETSTLTEDYLSTKWPLCLADKNLFINPAFLPLPSLVTQINRLQVGEKLICDHTTIAFAVQGRELPEISDLKTLKVKEAPVHIKYVWDIFLKNPAAIERDFKSLTKDRKSAKIPETVFTIKAENIFIEQGVKLPNISLNAEGGPIYIGKNAEIMEGSCIRGPAAIEERAVVKMGTKIYGGTTVGPFSKVGGELKNTVIFGYSNKGHAGYLGNSVLGEWCNLGANTNNSNLKNNYAAVKLWDYPTQKFRSTGLQFCGLFMGDHSKSSINTMFNTGTVVGVYSNVFDAGFPAKFISSFSWYTPQKNVEYRWAEAIKVAGRVQEQLDLKFSEEDKLILKKIFELTRAYRLK